MRDSIHQPEQFALSCLNKGGLHHYVIKHVGHATYSLQNSTPVYGNSSNIFRFVVVIKQITNSLFLDYLIEKVKDVGYIVLYRVNPIHTGK